MYFIQAEGHFDAAHFLAGYEGKCRNLHGHRWRVVAEVCAEELVKEGQTRGMVLDFSDLKHALKDLTEGFDHALVYEKGTLRESTEAALLEEDFRLVPVEFRPTAECFARYFFEELVKMGLPAARVEVYETPDNKAIYVGGR